jgi:anti-anti-sigma factor
VDPDPFTAVLDRSRDALVVTGEVDENAAVALRSAIDEATAGYTRALTIDLSAVSFLPSFGVGVLATSARRADENGQPIDLVAASGTIAQRVLEVCAVPHRTS